MKRVLGIALLCLAACARPCPTPIAAAPRPVPPPATPLASTQPPRPPADIAHLTKLAVLPIQDDELYRAERAQVRQLFAIEVAKRLPDMTVVPLTEVDAKLRPVSPKTGAACAFPGAPAERRARAAGFATTEFFHVLGGLKEPEQLWVNVSGWGSVITQLTATWNPKLERMASYQAAATALLRQDEPMGMLGGLAASGSAKNSATFAGVTLCEEQDFGACRPETATLADTGAEYNHCFRGWNAGRKRVLFDAGGRCELVNVDQPTQSEARIEQCLCAAVKRSSGYAARQGRRVLSFVYENPDLKGKVWPELSVVKVTTNLHAELDWHTPRGAGAVRVRRMAVDNMDTLGDALVRCPVRAGGTQLVRIILSEIGSVDKVEMLAGNYTQSEEMCIVNTVKQARFDCSSDGKPASLIISIERP